MKKIKFLAVALAAITMFSCSKENVENTSNDAPGENAKLTISVTGKGNLKPSSKAAGTAGLTDVTVNDYIVFLFRAGGGLDCAPQYSGNGNDLVITTGTTSAAKAYVVANTGALATSPFVSVTTEAELKAVVGDLKKDGAETSTQTSTNLWMTGNGNITYGEGVNAKKGNVTVALKFVGAKIELIVHDNRTNMTGGNITIVDKEVVLLFAGKEVKFFEDAVLNCMQSAFYSGDVSYPDPKAATKFDALSDAVKVGDFTANAANTVFNHFYTFGNDGMSSPTILAIKSTRTVKTGTPETIYYPVHFTTAEAGEIIIPGNSYTVTVTLNGDVNAGGGSGTTDPEVPIANADITVSVTPAEWNPVTVGKIFN